MKNALHVQGVHRVELLDRHVRLERLQARADLVGGRDQPDEQVGHRRGWNHVRCDASLDEPDVALGLPEHRVGRPLDIAQPLECVEQLLDRRFAQLRVRRVGRTARGAQPDAVRAAVAQRQLALGRLAVDEEAALILHILNDAWSDNWGFVPFTDREIAYAGKKFKPIVREDLIMIAEYEGQPVAFMMTLPDLNEVLKPMGGKLFPLHWIRLLTWLRKPRVRTMRVPLMGVVKQYQSSRLASQLAFMMIEFIRRNAVSRYGATRGEIGWILDDNQGMNAIAEAIDSHVNKEYTIYSKAL